MEKLIAILMSVFMFFCSLLGISIGDKNDPVVPEPEKKNVILMIGDGMGENTLEATKKNLGISLHMETMPVRGQSETRSFSSSVTDSAAGATALACATRTVNGYVAVDPEDSTIELTSIAEAAKAQGKAVGIITSDLTSGATPAGFSAHSDSRDNEEDISLDQLASGYDLIWGADTSSITAENCAENGYTQITTTTELEALNGSYKTFGQFNYDDMRHCDNYDVTPSLVALTQKATSILDKDKDGFFLMVECACIDKYSHNNNMEKMMNNVVAFDNAVEAALQFAAMDENTIVIVTADHETGGITYDSENDSYYYTTSGHTGVNVPLFVSESNVGFTDGEAIMNTDIALKMASILEIPQSEFPKKAS